MHSCTAGPVDDSQTN